jgi:serine/threonine protein kinase
VARLEANLRRGTKLELVSPRTRRSRGCTVGEQIGVGGSSKVYAATLADDSQIVLKVQRYEGELDPGLELEISLFKSIKHRNLIHCVGVGVTRHGHIAIGFRRAYQNPLLMLGKSSIAEEMRRDAKATYPSLPIDTALDLSYELLRALRYLERQGLVHHDVKLANLLIDVGPVKKHLHGPEVLNLVAQRKYRGALIDLGAARTREELDAWNGGRAAEGTPAPQITPFYAPPESVVEQRRDDGSLVRIFDASVDVYAAALVIYAMITGHPPYSHLQTPPDGNDLESIIGVKSAERRGEIEPISLAIIQRTVFDEAKFVGGDRDSFDLALHRFLLPRLSPTPAERGTVTDMTRDLEKLALINDRRGDSGRFDSLESSSSGAGKTSSQVYLPFTQGLVEVGGRAEHPLLKAARLHGVTEKFSRKKLLDGPDVQLKKKRPRAPTGPFKDAESGLVFVTDATDAGATPAELAAKRKREQQATRHLSRNALAKSAPEPEPEEEKSESITATAHGPLSNFAFNGSAAGLFVRYALNMLFTLLVFPTVLWGLAALGLLQSGLGASALTNAKALAGDPAGWGPLRAPWESLSPHLATVTEKLLALPPWAPGVALLVLLVCISRLSRAVSVYRIRNTLVFGSPLQFDSKSAMGQSISNASLALISGGLALPWIMLQRKRARYQQFSTVAGAPLDFQGQAKAIVGRGLLSVLLLPLTVASLGLLGLPLTYMWGRWEQINLVLPDAAGRLRSPQFTGTLGGYLIHAIPRWLLTALTLGLLRPWAVASGWRWLDAHTAV